jgi:hypothetical protein
VCPDGGDVIRLVEKAEGCDFLAAIERLGGRATIDPAAAKNCSRNASAKAPGAGKDRGRLSRGRAQAAVADVEGRDRGSTARRSPLSRRPRPAAAGALPGPALSAVGAVLARRVVDSSGPQARRADPPGPAMLAAFIRPDGKFGGLHMTWLTTDDVPPGKAEIIDPDRARC